jgi:hypothetical protein
LIKRFFIQNISLSDLQNPSAIVLILANLLPVFGVLFLGWEVFPILILYWMENVVVGFFNVLKMLFCKPEGTIGWQKNTLLWTSKVGSIAFFCFHYGIFTLVHGMFVFALFGGFWENTESDSFFGGFFSSPIMLQLLLGAVILFVSHGISFMTNYIGKAEYTKVTVNELMGQPYGRVVILHLTIIFGGGLISFLGAPVFALILLVVLKIGIDVLAHLKQHARTKISTVLN